MKPLRVGVIGCGNISDLYFESGKRFNSFDITACADIAKRAAREKAKKHGITKVMTPEALLESDEVDIVLNITVPKAHAAIARAAVAAGKHVYNEKPLTLTREEGKALLDEAKAKQVRVGCAPDTVLGAGIQTARRLIDEGAIGVPVSATAFMQCHGHESWHPSPEFFYEAGGGPMFDMGPYYLTALVTLFGPAVSVTAVTRTTFNERLITSEPKQGKRITVETPTHLAGMIEFKNGAVATMITSFDVWRATLPCIEIHGTEGSLSVPDPNTFGGDVKLFQPGDADWCIMPPMHAYGTQSRGLGLADMAAAIQSGRPHRAEGALAYHVLDIMQAFIDSGASRARFDLESGCERPLPMPPGLRDGYTD
ncbi:MAG: Gfo/Idh/MocA family oxidoreductase [Candidatus Hydrogenedentes bacterium]|nr:Gfo/Idh/MocA family oxidoreductase [Candidatus Hydrogenedentota bacterium]